MLFNSFEFIIFFPIVVAIYYLIPIKYRWIFLLLSSYYFYIPWKFKYIYLLIFATLVGYTGGIFIERTERKSIKKIFLIITLLFNFSLLFVFKYFGFFSESIEHLTKQIGITYSFSLISFVLPIGISFYTFQLISYCIDVYNCKIKAEKHLGIFSAYISFFPKILSGPIERAGDIIPQLRKDEDFSYDSVIIGSKRFLYGFFKKVVIADGIAFYFNRIFANPTEYYGISMILSVIFYSLKIYADFSGYTDMALGSARILNIKLTDNFRQPYFSKSVSEFWRNWHITLSSWLRDYLFLPLSYSFARKFMKSRIVNIRPDKWSYVFSILITMTLCGFWHGAKWTFIVWGFLHGFYLFFGFITRNKRKRLYRNLKVNRNLYNILSVIFTFILVSFAWIFFKSNSLNEAMITIKNCFTMDMTLTYFKINTELIVLMFSIIIMLSFEFIQVYKRNNLKEFPIENIVNLPLIILLIFLIVLFGKFEQIDFLYFKF